MFKRCRKIPFPIASFVILILIFFAFSRTVSAHGVRLFATAEGDVISGYAYASRGDRLKNATVLFLDAAEKEIGRTRTDENGEFQWRARSRTDHHLVLRLDDGHETRFLVGAEELGATIAAASAAAAVPPEPTTTTVATAPNAKIETIVERAVARQIRPLREQIDALENQTRLRDILGGIGYILGITGILFYLKTARRGKGSA